MLEQSIYNTVRYFALFEMPITIVQIWQHLLVDRSISKQRWEGHGRYSLAEIRNALKDSTWLQKN